MLKIAEEDGTSKNQRYFPALENIEELLRGYKRGDLRALMILNSIKVS